MIGKGKDITVRGAGSKQIENMGKRVRSRNGAKRALHILEQAMQDRRKRTQKLGPYKAGATVKAQKAVGKIEAAMKVSAKATQTVAELHEEREANP